MRPAQRSLVSLALLVGIAAGACTGPSGEAPASATDAAAGAASSAGTQGAAGATGAAGSTGAAGASGAAGAYSISPAGGTPATGPGERYNSCERIWCLVHGENFAMDHFAAGHVGFVMHTQRRGDVFAPRHRSSGPELPDAATSTLLLCGKHAHPWLLGKSGGRSIRHTGYNHALGYNRAHFQAYGTRLDPCCVNGLGSAFVHSSAGKQFRFHETSEYRRQPGLGWQKPFAARVSGRR